RCRGLAARDAGSAGGAAVDARHECRPRGDVLAAGGGGEGGFLVLTPCPPLRDAASPPVPLSAYAERGDEGPWFSRECPPRAASHRGVEAQRGFRRAGWCGAW